MNYLQGKEKELAMNYLRLAGLQAQKATCSRAKGGSIVVSKTGEIIGCGFNSPPLNLESQRRCTCDKQSIHRKVTDKTCCVHAEQRAIFEALKNFPDQLKDSTIYFVNVNEEGDLLFAGKPYCSVCSKMALETGIKCFVLSHKDGILPYDTKEYNLLSYQYSD